MKTLVQIGFCTSVFKLIRPLQALYIFYFLLCWYQIDKYLYAPD